MKSAFQKYGFVPFTLNIVLRQIAVNSQAFEDETKRRSESNIKPGSALQEIWSSLKTHVKLYQQTEAIRDIL